MLSQPKNRVQAIKSKFENLSVDSVQPVHSNLHRQKHECDKNKESYSRIHSNSVSDAQDAEGNAPEPKYSYLCKSDVKRTVFEPKPLTRQTSDPGKKLHRSHAFRCDRTQKITSPKRAGSISGRPEPKMERKLSKERLKRLGDVLDVQMRKENFITPDIVGEIKNVGFSVPDENVPPHILAQYAQVIKPKKRDDKNEAMTDSGVSSETENVDEERGRVKKISSQFEFSQSDTERKYPLVDSGNTQFEEQGVKKDCANSLVTPTSIFYTDTSDIEKTSIVQSSSKFYTLTNNSSGDQDKKYDDKTIKSECGLKKGGPNAYLQATNSLKSTEYDNDKTEYVEIKTNLDKMDKLAASSETVRLERKNPHITLTDTLKKALKQPLPSGPPPKKPPRTFNIPTIPEHEKNATKRKLEKLEQVLLKREVTKKDSNIYDIAEDNKSANIYDIAEEDASEKSDIFASKKYPSLKHPKEIHYLCTEILDITQRTLLPNHSTLYNSPLKNCFNLNCVTPAKSTSSLPYTRLSATLDTNKQCSCSTDSVNQPNCSKCQLDKCDKLPNSEFYVDEHIYDEPWVGDVHRSTYGTLNSVAISKSLEDLRVKEKKQETVYEILTDIRPSAPSSPKLPRGDFQKLIQNFENKPEEKSKLIRKSLENLKSNNHFDSDTKVEDFKMNQSDMSKVDRKSPLKDHATDNSKSSICAKVSVIDAKLSLGNTETRDNKFMKKEKRFATEGRRFKPERSLGYSLPVRNPQLDVDRKNLNALMNEIYETVTAACDMENKPGSFPTDQAEGSTSEDSAKLTRSLTEKRKNYVRRVSSRLAYLEPTSVQRYRHQTSICSYRSDLMNASDVSDFDNRYSTFRSWKSFRASQNNLKMDSESKFNLTDSTGNLTLKNDLPLDLSTESIDERAGCARIEAPYSRERQLFSVCLLVAIDGALATRKMMYPSEVQVPQHIENLIFPETMTQETETVWSADAASVQCYSFVLTDERGERSYGYCRRVVPEGASECLPLCYCLIGKFRAPGFYYKVLQLIESHHGSPKCTMDSLLAQLWDCEFPAPGESFNITLADADDLCLTLSDPTDNNNVKCTDRCQGDKCQCQSDSRVSQKYYDPENNNSLMALMESLDGIKLKTITRPLEPRAEETSSCDLLDTLGAGLLVKVFASLLLERKLIVRAEKLSALSSLLEGLQGALYPFVWQQPLISCVPRELQGALLDAPLPVLAGLLAAPAAGDTLEEGMFIDLGVPSLVRCYQGDESSILPTDSYKTLKTALHMDSVKNKDRDIDNKTRNVLISEAFLRFFVDILGDFWRFFSIGALKEGDMGKEDVVFDKEAFIKNATSKQNQYFLEWFTETAMFNHFIQNMAVRYKQTEPDSYKQTDSSKTDSTLIDTPTPNFYQLFEERVNSRRTRANVDRNGYKSALNKRVKLLKSRLRDLIG